MIAERPVLLIVGTDLPVLEPPGLSNFLAEGSANTCMHASLTSPHAFLVVVNGGDGGDGFVVISHR